MIYNVEYNIGIKRNVLLIRVKVIQLLGKLKKNYIQILCYFRWIIIKLNLVEIGGVLEKREYFMYENIQKYFKMLKIEFFYVLVLLF